MFAVIPHRPVASGSADLIEEVMKHLQTMFRMVDLGMKLNTVKAPALIRNRHIGTGVRMGHQRKPFWNPGHVVAVAHPGNPLFRNSFEQLAVGLIIGHSLAIFPGGILLSLCHHATQGIGHQLAAITDSQNRDTQLKDFRRVIGCARRIDAVGTTSKNNSDGVQRFQLLQRSGIGLYFTIDIALTNTARNQLVILPAKVQDNNKFMLHGGNHPFCSLSMGNTFSDTRLNRRAGERFFP